MRAPKVSTIVNGRRWRIDVEGGYIIVARRYTQDACVKVEVKKTQPVLLCEAVL